MKESRLLLQDTLNYNSKMRRLMYPKDKEEVPLAVLRMRKRSQKKAGNLLFEKMVKTMNNKYKLLDITHNRDLSAVTNI
jgi:hypothetical protein